MNPIRQLASQSAIYGLSSIVGRFLNYLLVPVYTALLPVKEYGVVTEMYTYVSFLFVIFTYGMETAFFRFIQENKSEKVRSTAVISLFVSSVILTVAGTFFAADIAALANEGQVDKLVRPEFVKWFIWILFFDTIVTIPFALLRSEKRSGKFASLKILSIVVNIGLNLFLLVLLPFLNEQYGMFTSIYNPERKLDYIFISNLISSAIIIPFLLKELLPEKNGWDSELWKKMLKYAAPLIFVGLAGMVNETLDRILLKYIYPDKTEVYTQLGIYGACYKLSILITLFIQAYRMGAEPFFFELAKKNNAQNIYRIVMNYFMIICSALFLIVVLFLDIFKEFINERYHSGLPVVPVLLMANLMLGIYYNLSIWYKLSDKTNIGALVSVSGAAVTIVINILFIPEYGYIACAWATLICYTSMVLISYLLGQKYYPVSYDLGTFFISLGSVIIFYCISETVEPYFSAIGYYAEFLFNTFLLGCYAMLAIFLLRRKNIVNSPT